MPPDSGRVRETALFLVLLAAGALLREWTSAERLAGMDFPVPLDPFRAAVLLAGVALSFAAAFALAGRGFLAGLGVGLALGPAGWCAARLQPAGRAVELAGSAFFGWLLAAATVPLLALTAAFLVEAVVDKRWRPRAARLAALAAALWLAATFGAEALLAGVWGYGPASLSEAAEVPTKADADIMTIAWLYPARGEAVRVEDRRMSDERVDLSPESLAKLEAFLERRRLRDVFADDALGAVRRGWLLWWEAERALDAAMLAVPGRAGPDYRRALELLRAGPLTDARLSKLRQLDAAATQNRRAGFEGVTASQYIFEGFSGAYARFGLEEDARRWLYKIDDLWPVNDKRIEVTPIEDMRDGRIAGRLVQDGRGVSDVRVGLFFAWRSTATNSTHYFLSGSVFPDADGRFSFDALGPGRYHLALMGTRERLAGGARGSPGFIELGYDRPDAMLAPIRLGWGGDEGEADAAPPPAEELLHRGTFLPVPGRAP